MAHAVVPLMRARRAGVILNIGSTAGIRPRPGLTWYNGSKGAVNLLSKSMAVELGPDGIRVNAICPVIGETGLLEKFMGVPDTPENRARFIATIPLGRMSKPVRRGGRRAVPGQRRGQRSSAAWSSRSTAARTV